MRPPSEPPMTHVSSPSRLNLIQEYDRLFAGLYKVRRSRNSQEIVGHLRTSDLLLYRFGNLLGSLAEAGALRLRLPGAADYLEKLEEIETEDLKGLAKCSEVHIREIVRSSLIQGTTKFVVGLGGVLASLKVAVELFGWDLSSLASNDGITLTVVLLSGVVGFLMFAAAVSAPWLGCARELGALIEIALARRPGVLEEPTTRH